MSTHLKYLYPTVLMLTGIVLACSILFPDFMTQVEVGVFVGVMLLTGIPHGATDHCIDAYNCNNQGRRYSLGRFLLNYLIAVSVYASLWYLFPIVSLVIFLLISCYHFGQSQLEYFFPSSVPTKIQKLLYTLWGATVLGGIILFNAAESEALLVHLFPQINLSTWNMGRVGLLAIGTGIGMAYWGAWGERQFWKWAWEMGNLLILLSLSYYSNLLISFAVYFGLWHSLASIRNEIAIFRQSNPRFSWAQFCRLALPLSFISILGIGLLLGGMYWIAPDFSPYLLFFIAIAALTLPHMIYMERFYQMAGTNPSEASPHSERPAKP